MSWMQRTERYLFEDPHDRITLCDDSRAHVRLPARALRSVVQTIWLILTCSWTTILIPIMILALRLDSTAIDITTFFWLNCLALLPAIGLFRYASEVLSVEAPALVKTVWGFTLEPFSLDVEVCEYSSDHTNESNFHFTGRFHCPLSWTFQTRQNLYRWQNHYNPVLGETTRTVRASGGCD